MCLGASARLTATAGVEQNRPMFTPGVAKRADSPATARSHDATSWQPAAVIAAGKAALRRQLGLSLADAYADASQAMADGLARPDAAEGIGAFLDKRPPTWRS